MMRYMNPKESWFNFRRIGWICRPATREGWAICAGYFIILIWDFVRIDKASHSASDTLIALAPDFVALTLLLLLVFYATGEWPRALRSANRNSEKSTEKEATVEELLARKHIAKADVNHETHYE